MRLLMGWLLVLAVGCGDSITDTTPASQGDPGAGRSGDDAGGTSGPDHGTGTKAPLELEDTGTRGRLGVGHTFVIVQDEDDPDRALPVEVWYPTEATDGALTSYLIGEMGGLKLKDDSTFVLAEPPAAEGPWPFVIFSHGYGAIRNQSLQLCEVLASHGFVVVSADHVGNTAADEFNGIAVDFDTAAAQRPADVKTLLDAFLGEEPPADMLKGQINAQEVGITGHSFGGYTALVGVGGLASAGAAGDPRIKAIAPISPGAQAMTEDDWAAVNVPTLFLAGTADTVTPIEPSVTGPYAAMEGRPRYRVDVHGATHTHFANICRIGNLLIENGLKQESWESVGAGQLLTIYEETCGEDAFPIEKAHRLESLYVVAFFRAHLAGETDYAAYLTPGYSQACEEDVTFYGDVEPDARAAECLK